MSEGYNIFHVLYKLHNFSYNPEDFHFAEIKRVVRYLRQDPEKGIIWWRKESRITLPVGSIIPKVDMDTQIPCATNTNEAVTYIDASHATWLRKSISVNSFVITLFISALYYKSEIQYTVATM